MCKVMKYIGSVICSVLLVAHVMFVAVRPVFAAEEKVTLGSFVLYGLSSNMNDGEQPDWFKKYMNEHMDDISNKRSLSLEVTKAQAEEITALFSDDMVPLMYTPEEANMFVADMRGVEALSNLKAIGYASADSPGIWHFPFSREQLSVLYVPVVEYFAERDVATLWPHMDITSISKNPETFTWDNDFRSKLLGNAMNKTNELKEMVRATDLPEETKTKLINDLDTQYHGYETYVNDEDTKFLYYMKKYEPTIDTDYTESKLTIQKEVIKHDLEKVAHKELEELNKDPEKNKTVIEELNKTLNDALLSVDTIKKVEELEAFKKNETLEITAVYPTALVAEAERLAALAQDAVDHADTDQDGKISIDEKSVVDEAISAAEAARTRAIEEVNKLALSPLKDLLEGRIAALRIPATVEVTPEKPAEVETPATDSSASNPSQPVVSPEKPKKAAALPKAGDIAAGSLIFASAASLLCVAGSYLQRSKR